MLRYLKPYLLFFICLPALAAENSTVLPLKELEQLKQSTPNITNRTQGLEKSKMKVESAALRAVVELYRAEKIDEVLLKLDTILQDQELSESDRKVAQFFMGKALFQKRYYYASVPFFQQQVAGDAHDALYPYSFQRLVWLANRDGKYDILTEALKNRKSSLVPRAFRDDFYYILAKSYFDEHAYDKVLQAIGAISSGSLYFPETQLMKGLILLDRKQADAALEAFQDAAQSPDENVKGVAFLALARLHYGRGESKTAALYYGRISKTSKHWLSAQLESAWSRFLTNEPSLALGSLHLLDSEAFLTVFSPEASIIKGTVFFRLCRYRETEQAIDVFFQRYLPVYQRLQAFNSKYKNDEKAYRQEVLKAIYKSSLELPERLTAEIFAQSWFNTRLNQLTSMKDELDRFNKMGAFTETVHGLKTKEYLEGQMQQLTDLIIAEAVPLLKSWETKLEGFVRQASRLRFESAFALIDFQKQKQKRGYEIPDDPQFEVWTFDEEYWSDELGDYRYLLRSQCGVQG